VGKAHRKPAAHLEFANRDGAAAHLWIVDINLRWPDRQGSRHRARNTCGPFCWRSSAQAFGIDEVMRIFIEHSLKIVIHAVGENAVPVAILGAAPKQGDRIVLVEERAKGPSNLGSGAEQSRIIPC